MTERVPKKMKPRFDEITAITDAVCREHLNDEYGAMSRKMAATLARKRPSPLARGRANSWACGIVYALGFVNFLFDKSFPPHLGADELCTLFGVSKATGYNKSKEIRDMLDLMQFHPDWTVPSMIEENPLVWMLSVNDFIMDVRNAPRHIQEEAYRKGLIPYLPEDGEPSPTVQKGKKPMPFDIGDSVVVKAGVKDPDYGDDLGGWQGRVVEIDVYPPDPPLVTLVWDSITLRNIPSPSIIRDSKEGLDWTTMLLHITELEPAFPRDQIEDVEHTVHEIIKTVIGIELNDQDKRILKVLAGVDLEDAFARLDAWFDHLDKHLEFPFEAKSMAGSYGPIRQGDIVRVIAFNDIFDDYGILVDVKKGRSTYQLPLVDLDVTQKDTPQYQLVNDYGVWFANR